MTYPYSTGDVLTAADMNSLSSFTINSQTGTSYTAVLNDQYSRLVSMNNAAANDFLIPTDASVAFPVGTVLNVYMAGAGVTTIKAATPATTTVVSVGAVAASPVLARYKTAAAIKLAANSWVVVGGIA